MLLISPKGGLVNDILGRACNIHLPFVYEAVAHVGNSYRPEQILRVLFHAV